MACRREWDARDIVEQGLIGGIEDAARAGGHGSHSVAMIGVLEGENARAPFAAIVEVTECHLQGDLDGGGAAVGIEHAGEASGCQRHQFTCKFFSRLVREAGKDHLIETLGLLSDRSHDPGMTVPMRDHPP